MKCITTKVGITILSICLITPSLVLSQSKEWTKEEKLRRIDREIAEAQAQKKSGLIKMGAGLGLYVLGYAVFLPTTTYTYDWETGGDTKEEGNSTLFAISLIGGLVLELWGGYQWWDGAQTASRLKAKRYDIGLKPMIRPDVNGNLRYALALQVEF